MDVQTVVANVLGANHSVFIDKALDGLTDADLATCPIAGANVFKKTYLQGVKHADARIQESRYDVPTCRVHPCREG